ncbi:MAG: prolipoprotein diacylglyceryl transferase [Proteobacteria bacterium]|nr:prolipoprotein diacylglyceryl transferase [Pseudomonadota bacterium]
MHYLVNFDPVLLTLGPIKIHWYAITYLIGFGFFILLGNWQVKNTQTSWTKDQVSDFLFYGALGVILGGRIGWVLFYNDTSLLEDPLLPFKVQGGGMSFHGGLLGSILAGYFYCKRVGLPYLELLDRFAVVAPLGLAFGRMGNFINGELWGRIADPESVPWAMIFPGAGDLPRHPSQLYEMALEGVLLFLILWFTRKQAWAKGTRIAIFWLGYAVTRIFCENFREPDAQLGFIFANITMGMLQSSAMIVAGLAVLFWVKRRG